ncbi:hypothetical protein Scep_001731 [Stephania cephalantha]|uniref:CWZF3/5/7 THD domain-containing protein n=1 Tax=Stephania cephalantha TaxID=152367 RepID=A0AAP0Q415_9MAGN
MDCLTSRHPEFHYKTEFQSHEPEFDYLKSLEIEKKINKIRWCQSANGSLFLLSTNDMTIKLWKVQEKNVKKICDVNIDTSNTSINGSVPSTSTYPKLRRMFVAHEYERCKELASAALAYKCMEMAYMRVIYAKHMSANRDRNELQSAFLMLPLGNWALGESPPPFSFLRSFVDEDANEKLAPYSALSGDESYSNRDLEKVAELIGFQRCMHSCLDVCPFLNASQPLLPDGCLSLPSLTEGGEEGLLASSGQ